MSDEPNAGRGEMLVDMVLCLERSMEHAERVHPAVDHLSVHRLPPDEAELARVRARIETLGSEALLGAFDQWWQLERDLSVAMGRLNDMHQREAEPGPDYESELTECIRAVREVRVALEQRSVELRRQAALEIDAPGGR